MGMYRVIYTEITADRGYKSRSGASDGYGEYVTTSAYMHDAISTYKDKYQRLPSRAWYRKQCRWTKERVY